VFEDSPIQSPCGAGGFPAAIIRGGQALRTLPTILCRASSPKKDTEKRDWNLKSEVFCVIIIAMHLIQVRGENS
jgi:hypothetical protein